jgi:glycosyltransferase involved in cell wall biosynthesis
MITFAIPFYKGRDYLHRALRSVMAQTNGQWRVLICDDGDDPEVEKIVASISDERIQYHRNPGRLGMVGNWNRCLELAETPYVTLLHADDELLPHYVEAMKVGWQSFPDAVLLFCRAKVIDSKSRPVFSFPDFYKKLLMPTRSQAYRLSGEAGVRRLLKGNFIFCPSVCFRKSALGTHRFSPKWKMVQDLELWTRLLLRGGELVGIPEHAYAYRRHSENTTTQYTQNLLRFREETQLYAELANTLAQVGATATARVARRATIIKLNVAYCLFKDLCAFEWRAAGEKAAFLWGLLGSRRRVHVR